MEEGTNRGTMLSRLADVRRLQPTGIARWRCARRVLDATLFKPYIMYPLLRGTWLYNLWVRGMGANVSMGALMLGYVNDHDFVQVGFRSRN